MIRLSTGLRRSLATTTGLGSMLNGGYIFLFGGVQPMSADTGSTSDPLAIITQDGGPMFDGAVTDANGLLVTEGPTAGTLANSGIWIATGLKAGTATWWRFVSISSDFGTVTSTAYPRVDGGIGEGLEAIGFPAIAPESTYEITRFLLTLPASSA